MAFVCFYDDCRYATPREDMRRCSCGRQRCGRCGRCWHDAHGLTTAGGSTSPASSSDLDQAKPTRPAAPATVSTRMPSACRTPPGDRSEYVGKWPPKKPRTDIRDTWGKRHKEGHS